MMGDLPAGDFAVDNTPWDAARILALPEGRGATLEATIRWPLETHDRLARLLVPCPTRERVDEDAMSSFMVEHGTVPTESLVATLRERRGAWSHHELREAIAAGAEVEVHAAVTYREAPILRPVGELFQGLRQSHCPMLSFLGKFLVLMGYGRCALDKSQFSRVRTIARDDPKIDTMERKWLADRRHRSFTDVGRFRLHFMAKTDAVQDQPVFLAAAITSRARVANLRLLDRLDEHYGARISTVQHLTDSFLLRLLAPEGAGPGWSPLADLAASPVWADVDASTLDADHALHGTDNRRCFGKWKLEAPEIWRFVGPRAGQYQWEGPAGSKSKASGLAAESNNATFAQAVAAVHGLLEEDLLTSTTLHKRRAFELVHKEVVRTALTNRPDATRFVLAGGVETVPLGFGGGGGAS